MTRMKTRGGILFSIGAVAVLALAGQSETWAQGDLHVERSQTKAMLRTVAKTIEKEFHDASLRGLDWKHLRADAERRIDEAKSLGQMVTAVYSFTTKLDDSHTAFIPPLRGFNPQFGFELKAYGDQVRVSEVKKGSAAEQTGLKVGDRVFWVNGYRAERKTLFQMMYFFRVLMAVPRMELVTARDDEAPQTVVVEAKEKWRRPVIDLRTFGSNDFWDLVRESEKGKKKFKTATYEPRIGYIKIPAFTPDAHFFSGVFDDVKDTETVIIDLRDNPGGRVDSLTAAIGFFEPAEVAVAEIVGRKKTEALKARPGRPNFSNVPLVILVDSRSHSAAEVFARHFQLKRRAQVVGDRSAGTVTVGRVFPHEMGVDTVLPYASYVAVARLVFPDGQELEKSGVIPDHLCIPTGPDLREELDPCLDLAVELARKALRGEKQAETQ